MIVRLIILVVLLWLGFRIYKLFQAKKQNTLTPPKTMDMVSCATCGIHIPTNEALKDDGKYYCSRNHLPK